MVLLTNLSERELPGRPVGAARLSRLPLVVPTSGLVADFLAGWYGPDFTSQLDIVAQIEDIYHGLSILRSSLVRGCMLVTPAIGRAVLAGALPGGPGLRVVGLATDFEPRLELVTGVFTRKGEREHHEPEHPLNLLWDALKRQADAESSR